MSDISLFLGGITFQDFEVPEKLVFGGAQRVIAHELIGGGRAIDVLGGQPAQISFRGIMSGSNAVGRAQALDAARVAGNAINLGWQNFVYSVVISELCLDYEKSWWIPFEVRCMVVLDPAMPVLNVIAPLSNLIDNDLNLATTYASQARLLGTVLTSASVPAAQEILSTSLSSMNDELACDNMAVTAARDGLSGIAAVTQLADISASLAAVATMNGYVNRAAINIVLGNS
ncbi:MAG: hypothetical protein P4L54_02340 [Acidocella sp.]|nr:hypothetical protein [Acidocella sp.]